jgi:hypothetical protein
MRLPNSVQYYTGRRQSPGAEHAHVGERHPDATVTSLIPALSCRSCRPHAPFAELVRLSKHSIADELNVSRNRERFGS